jgi:hypothetical protein
VFAAAALTFLSRTAMAQGNGKPRLDVQDQSAGAEASTLPDTAAGLADWNYSVGAYMPNWSQNPGTFNSQTAEPAGLDLLDQQFRWQRFPIEVAPIWWMLLLESLDGEAP